jgi:alkylated DNA repair dioxygenase AlkB
VSTPLLFDLGPPQLPPIPGLSLWRDYVTEAEEADMVSAIDRQAWDTSWERRRQPFGYTYGNAQVTAPAIPGWGVELAQRMLEDGITDRPFDQMLINEYLPGQGITLHRDYEPFDRTVVSLSLLSACVMEFRRILDGHRESILLQPRSLLILSDEARYEWEHGIARRKSDRWQGCVIPRGRRLSVTFRLSKLRARKS